jgi:hypothetical protein
MAVKGIIPSVAEDDAQLVRRLGVAVAAVWTDLSSASQALILEQAAAVDDAQENNTASRAVADFHPRAPLLVLRRVRHPTNEARRKGRAPARRTVHGLVAPTWMLLPPGAPWRSEAARRVVRARVDGGSQHRRADAERGCPMSAERRDPQTGREIEAPDVMPASFTHCWLASTASTTRRRCSRQGTCRKFAAG